MNAAKEHASGAAPPPPSTAGALEASRSQAVPSVPGVGHLSAWLLASGSRIDATPELLSGLAARMIELGIAVSQLRVMLPSSNPLVTGFMHRWSRATGATETVPFPQDRVKDTGGVAAGMVLPLPLLHGADGWLALQTDRAEGFSRDEVAEVSNMAPVFALLLSVQSVRHSAKTLLETYIGRHTGRRVLEGQVGRGTGERIHAVIWFCDLRDSTRLAEALPPEAFLTLLNDFFDCMAGAVLEHGGEVLRFIGDAALAIFPIGDTSRLLEEACTPSEGACRRALDAAKDARRRVEALNARRREAGEAPIRYGLALHVGDVMYANIGVAQRLEFTVVGRAANEAARLESLCKSLGEPILISAAFPRCFPAETRSLGTHSLRDVSEPQEVFALRD